MLDQVSRVQRACRYAGGDSVSPVFLHDFSIFHLLLPASQKEAG